MTALNTIRFAAYKPQQPIWNIIRSNGDGSSSTVSFTSEAEADKLAELDFRRFGEASPDVQQVRTVYDSVAEYLQADGDEEGLALLLDIQG